MSASSRQLSPYEHNHLRKHGVNPDQIERYGEMPVEYITGKVEFAGLEFMVTPATLIPRVETEELVHKALAAAEKWCNSFPQQAITIIDIGTGSGAIGISLGVKLEQRQLPYQLYLSDLSPDALAVAHQNAAHLLHQSPTHIESNLWQNIDATLQFDMITANLPYIPHQRMPDLEPSVKEFEPWLALDGGPTGLELITTLVEGLDQHLSAYGVAWLELDDTHTPSVIDKAFSQSKSHLSWTNHQDHFDKNRFVEVKRI
ncbi:MAG TPA: HemK/PrmC family methyltransferase [Vitreimonas sp.]|nr:HemK/PrmC family methyltransferase [Vitreimonas sp.]